MAEPCSAPSRRTATPSLLLRSTARPVLRPLAAAALEKAAAAAVAAGRLGREAASSLCSRLDLAPETAAILYLQRRQRRRRRRSGGQGASAEGARPLKAHGRRSQNHEHRLHRRALGGSAVRRRDPMAGRTSRELQPTAQLARAATMCHFLSSRGLHHPTHPLTCSACFATSECACV